MRHMRWALLAGIACAWIPAGAVGQAPASEAVAANDGAQVRQLYAAGKYDEALVVSGRRIAAARAAGDMEELASAQSDHGSILIQLERFKEAEAALREALALSTKVRGPEHRSTLVALNNLAAMFQLKEQPAQALPLFDDLVQRRSRMLGKDTVGWQVWDNGLLDATLSRAEMRAETGQRQKAIDELLAVFDAVNIAFDDNAVRADYLERLADLLADGEQLAKLGSPQALAGPSGLVGKPDVPIAGFLSRSSALGPQTDDAYERQADVARRAYEAAGDTEHANATAATMPNLVKDRFDEMVDAGRPDEAFTVLEQAVDRLAGICASICTNKELYVDLLEFQADEATEADRRDDLIRALTRLADLQYHTGTWGFGTETERRYRELAEALDAAGRAEDAAIARYTAEVAAEEPNLDVGKSPRLQLARKLRQHGRAHDADAIVREELKCGFSSDPKFFESKLPSCETTRFAMSEYATLLEAQGKKKDAEFYRLPREIAAAYEGQDDAGARRKAERMLVLAADLFPADALNYRQAMAYFEAVHKWYDLPLYDIPKDYRVCGRWDEPEPPKPKPKPGEYALPMVSVAAPKNQSLYFNSIAKLTPLDPRGIFYHSMTNVAGNSFDRYIGQCLSAGRIDEGMKVTDWAIGEANRRGYDGSERHRLMMTKAALHLETGDTRAAERAYQEQLEVYLSKKDSLPAFTGDDIIQALLRLYLEANRAESLQALIVRIAESGLIDNNPAAQVGFREALFEMYLARGDAEQAERLLVTLTPERVRYDSGRTYTYQLKENRAEDDGGYAARTREAKFFSQVARLLEVQGKPREAEALLEKTMAENETFFAGLPDKHVEDKVTQLGMLNAIPAMYLGKMRYARGDYAGSLEMIDQGLAFPKLMMERLAGAEGGALLAQLAEARKARNVDADTKQAINLFDTIRGAYAAAAEVALRAGNTEASHQYFDMAKRLPAPEKVGLPELQVLWTSVGLGIVEPPRRSVALADARALAGALEEQWRLRTRYPLDASATQLALQMGPQYFGDIAALAWAARGSSEPGFEEATVFEHVQRALLDSVDMSISASIGRAALVRAKPDAVKLLDERDELATTLLGRTAVRVGMDGIEVGDNAEAERTAEVLDRKPRQRQFDQQLSRLDAIDAQVRRDAPEYFALTSTEPVALAEAKALLGPGEAVLLAAPGRFGTQLMLLTAEGLEWRQSALTLDQIANMTRRLRFSAGAEVETTSAERREWLGAVDGGYNGFDRKTGHALYEELVAPFASRLAGKTQLFVAGGGPLTALPFSILVSRIAEGRDDDPRTLRETGWLGEDIALVQIPSLQSLALLRRFAPTSSGASGEDFLGFGDPVLSGEAENRGVRRAAPSAPGPAVWKVAAGEKVVDVAQLKLLERLPGTARELKDMAEALGATPASLRLGPAATESEVKHAALAGKKVLAFATHGLTTGQLGAFEPGLVLTPPAVGTPQDDGLLTASEVAGLSLDADWVILSACNTASGDGKGGAPGLSGLARAFFQAGARGLLVSHWPVRDDVAARLSVDAVKLRRADPSLTKAEAMRRAMRGIRLDPHADGLVKTKEGDLVQTSWAHPSAWAPFSFVGDGR